LIYLDIPIQHLQISNGVAKVELLNPAEAQKHLDLNKYTFGRYQREGWVPAHHVGRTFLYLRHELDMAKEVEDSPVREHRRMKDEKVEEATRG